MVKTDGIRLDYKIQFTRIYYIKMESLNPT